MVQAKCVQKAWDSINSRFYVPDGGPLPGGLYELDLANPAHRKLADLKTQMGPFIFQFDRLSANDPASGLYFCPDCGTRFETLSLIGNHMRHDHKKTGWEPPVDISEPDLEPEEVIPPREDRRGKVPVTCKGCGQSVPNIGSLGKHKLSCPGKPPEAVAQGASEEVAQAPPA